jgi:hypothetical protein
VIRRDHHGGWHAWICCHPLDEPGEEDRMSTAYATGADGLAWDRRGTVLTLPDGTHQLFYEAPLPDGSHELRTRNVTTLRRPA